MIQLNILNVYRYGQSNSSGSFSPLGCVFIEIDSPQHWHFPLGFSCRHSYPRTNMHLERAQAKPILSLIHSNLDVPKWKLLTKTMLCKHTHTQTAEISSHTIISGPIISLPHIMSYYNSFGRDCSEYWNADYFWHFSCFHSLTIYNNTEKKMVPFGKWEVNGQKYPLHRIFK